MFPGVHGVGICDRVKASAISRLWNIGRPLTEWRPPDDRPVQLHLSTLIPAARQLLFVIVIENIFELFVWKDPSVRKVRMVR